MRVPDREKMHANKVRLVTRAIGSIRSFFRGLFAFTNAIKLLTIATPGACQCHFLITLQLAADSS